MVMKIIHSYARSHFILASRQGIAHILHLQLNSEYSRYRIFLFSLGQRDFCCAPTRLRSATNQSN